MRSVGAGLNISAKNAGELSSPGLETSAARRFGAQPINALVTSIDCPTGADDRYTIHYSRNDLGRKAPEETLDVDVIIGADGANSRVAKAIDAGEYNFAIAFQERIKIDDEKMAFYDELAEMYRRRRPARRPDGSRASATDAAVSARIVL